MLVANPQSFGLEPMMINTKNPNGSATPGGPLPSGARSPAGAEYSGLLECPCTDRKAKVSVNRRHTAFSCLCIVCCLLVL